MIKRLLRIILLLLISSGVYLYSCSGVPSDEVFDLDVESFKNEIGVDASDVKFFFTNLNPPTVGRCFPGIKMVQIDLSFYLRASPIERRALVYHELGHCSCNLFIHSEPEMFCGKSLMIPYMLGRDCYNARWNEYIKDLKELCK